MHPPLPGRQREILETFTELVAAQGYDMTSLSEIAGRLNLSKGTIMHHFGSKDRMLQLMSLEYMQRRSAELEVIATAIESPAEQLATVVLTLLTAHRDDRSATLAISREFVRFADQPVMHEVRELRERYQARLTEIVELGVRSRELRATDPSIVALQILGMCTWSWTWLDPDGRLTPEQIAEIFIDTALGGLLSDRSLLQRPLRAPPAIRGLRRR